MPQSDTATVRAEGGAVVVERVFAAPRELLWQMWTRPEHVLRWYGPAGMTAQVCEIDLRVGGRYLWGLRSADGFEYYNAGVFRELVLHERIVASMCMADAEGHTVPASHYGLPDDAPSETLLTVLFQDLDDGTTHLTVRQEGWADDAMAAGAGGGWSQALDKLAALLEQVGQP